VRSEGLLAGPVRQGCYTVESNSIKMCFGGSGTTVLVDAFWVYFSRSCLQMLTPRERDILQPAAKGRDHLEMASDLQISPRTVDFQRAKLMRKFSIDETAALLRYALRPPELLDLEKHTRQLH
jgi:DNA-binding CsgD family transcriptional regulator